MNNSKKFLYFWVNIIKKLNFYIIKGGEIPLSHN